MPMTGVHKALNRSAAANQLRSYNLISPHPVTRIVRIDVIYGAFIYRQISRCVGSFPDGVYMKLVLDS